MSLDLGIKWIVLSLVLGLLLQCAATIVVEEPEQEQALYICTAGDAKFLGKFVMSEKKSDMMDGVEAWFNDKDMAIFRNKGFWYIGDPEPWPPVTHYRCVQEIGCNYGERIPPTSRQGTWAASGHGKDPAPIVLNEPCGRADGGSSINSAIASEEL
jgi:hypothetical protein